jgi:LmbE family N-acetylglucosaminyl deacetylase
MRVHGRILCIAAHPDDETIGAGAWLARVKDVHVLHVTDGAPREPRLRSRPDLGREEYAQLRRKEVTHALAVAGMAPWRASCLGAVDLEAIDAVARLAPELARIIHELAPTTILTHPYEGGHPDHDATALVVYAARELARRRRALVPPTYEMTSYYGRGGRLSTASFLVPNLAAPAAEAAHARRLSCDERAMKRAMFDCFESQRAVLAPFATFVERIRIAPLYQFDVAPHAGPLWYERQGLGTGKAWRERAAVALASLDLAQSIGTAAE